jgi:hypothetical protein
MKKIMLSVEYSTGEMENEKSWETKARRYNPSYLIDFSFATGDDFTEFKVQVQGASLAEAIFAMGEVLTKEIGPGVHFIKFLREHKNITHWSALADIGLGMKVPLGGKGGAA